MDATQRYRYSPLAAPSEHLRLFQIHPQPVGNDVSGTLISYQITSHPLYVALSYTWGAPEQDDEAGPQAATKSLTIGSATLPITANLADALQRFVARMQHPDSGDMFLWIDAVCIDQENVNERNQQVAMMDLIYSRAQHVVLWTGPDPRGEAPLLMDMLPKFTVLNQTLDKVIAQGIKAGRLPETSGGIDHWKPQILSNAKSALLESAGLPPIGDPSWLVLLSFLRRRCFSRVWIVQEIALAKRIVLWLGDAQMDWDDFDACCTILNRGVEHALYNDMDSTEEDMSARFEFRSTQGSATSSIRQWCQCKVLPEMFSIYYKLFSGSEKVFPQLPGVCVFLFANAFAASDLRDKVFGLLGIFKAVVGSQNTLIDVDYRRDIAQVFTDATRSIVEKTNWLGYLCAVLPNIGSRCSGLPSWALDYGQDTLPILSTQGDTNFNALGRLMVAAPRLSPRLEFDRHILKTHGIKVMTLDGISEPLVEVYEHRMDFEEGSKLLINQPQTYVHTHEPLVDAFWKTLIASGTVDASNEEWRHSFKTWWLYHMFLRATFSFAAGVSLPQYLDTLPNMQLSAEQDHTGTLSQPSDVEDIVGEVRTGNRVDRELHDSSTRFTLAFAKWALHRRLFRTSDGYFGLGLQSIGIGDEVWIMSRSPVPFILRSMSNGHYTFGGECYVHGIMHGEYFGAEGSPQWEAINIE